MSKLILFDIDHTLVDVFSLQRAAYRLMFLQIFEIEADLMDIWPFGKTTDMLIREISHKHGLAEGLVEMQLEAARQCLFEFTDQLYHDLKEQVLPGIFELLGCLKLKDYRLGIVTGNTPLIGQLILERAGLASFFEIGAFGPEAASRVELVSLAVRRANQKWQTQFSGRQVVVIGDSIHDVQAGQAYGAITVAVATGFDDFDKLKSYRPDYSFQNCSNWPQICRSLSELPEAETLRQPSRD